MGNTELDLGLSVTPEFDLTKPESGFVQSDPMTDKFAPPLRGSHPPLTRPTEKPSFDNTREFFLQLVRRGDHLFIPRGSHESSERFERDIYIAVEYTATDKSRDEIGYGFGITYERVRQVVKLLVPRALSIDTRLQEIFPNKSMLLTKPRTDRQLENMSKSRAKTASVIISRVKAGASYDDLREAGFTFLQIHSARESRFSAINKVAIPRKVKTPPKELKESIGILRDENSSPEERQKILALIADRTSTSYLNYRSSGDSPHIALISHILKELGFTARRGKILEFVALLKTCGIPADVMAKNITTDGYDKHQRYGFVAYCDRQKAIDEIRSNPMYRELVRDANRKNVTVGEASNND